MPGPLGLLQRLPFPAWPVAFWLLLLAWPVVFVVFLLLIALQQPAPLSADAKPLGDLKVYLEDPNHYGVMPRDKAIDFGLDKATSAVNYLLLAAAAVLGFTVKTIMEFRADSVKGAAATRQPSRTPGRAQVILLLHGGIGCFFSISCGVTAWLYLPQVATYTIFSVANEVGRCLLFQILSLLFALLLLLTALGLGVRDLLS